MPALSPVVETSVKLTQVAIARPLAVTMAILALVLMGLIAHARLGVDLLPSVTYPYISVGVTYPGASPTDVETLITKPVEDAVAGLPNAQHVSSTSQEGLSRVVVQFADGTDTGQAAIDVEQAINGIKTTL